MSRLWKSWLAGGVLFIHAALLPLAALRLLAAICTAPGSLPCHPRLHFARPRATLHGVLTDNSARTREARAWLQGYRDERQVSGLGFAWVGQGDGIEAHLLMADTVVLIITAERLLPPGGPPPAFATQTLVRVLRLLEATPDLRTVPLLCASGSGLEADALRPAVAVVHNARGGDRPLPSLPKWQEKLDYAECLRQALRRSPRASFILALEDDAYPHSDLLHRLGELKEKLSFRAADGSRGPVHYIKLHHPNELRKVPWLVHAVIAGLLWGAAVAGAAQGLVALLNTSHLRWGAPLILLLFTYHVSISSQSSPCQAIHLMLGR